VGTFSIHEGIRELTKHEIKALKITNVSRAKTVE